MSASPFNYEFKSDFARKYIQQGKVEGKVEGREEGREEGLETGRREATVQAIFVIFAGRELSITEEQRATIAGCSEFSTLERWLQLAIKVSSVDEMLAA